MKKAFTFLLFIAAVQVGNAHPGLVEHTHETFFGAYGWMIIPIVIIFGIGLYYLNNKKTHTL